MGTLSSTELKASAGICVWEQAIHVLLSVFRENPSSGLALSPEVCFPEDIIGIPRPNP